MVVSCEGLFLSSTGMVPETVQLDAILVGDRQRGRRKIRGPGCK
jgi:hypothetical protein